MIIVSNDIMAFYRFKIARFICIAVCTEKNTNNAGLLPYEIVQVLYVHICVISALRDPNPLNDMKQLWTASEYCR